jgi:hypothetical protein
MLVGLIEQATLIPVGFNQIALADKPRVEVQRLGPFNLQGREHGDRGGRWGLHEAPSRKEDSWVFVPATAIPERCHAPEAFHHLL